MIFTFECPNCKKRFDATHTELASHLDVLQCGICGKSPAPDIVTAYNNIGKTMVDLYGRCECSTDKEWLPKNVKY